MCIRDSNKNAQRLNSSLRKLLMPEISEEKFIDACMQVVKANEAYVPPYGTCLLYTSYLTFIWH